jgi:hypothetical protein
MNEHRPPAWAAVLIFCGFQTAQRLARPAFARKEARAMARPKTTLQLPAPFRLTEAQAHALAVLIWGAL